MGYFMHFSTSSGNQGDKAFLESRLLYPKRGFQCLQFFHYNSGHVTDELSIWVREYDKSNPNGTLRLIQTVTGETTVLVIALHVHVVYGLCCFLVLLPQYNFFTPGDG